MTCTLYSTPFHCNKVLYLTYFHILVRLVLWNRSMWLEHVLAVLHHSIAIRFCIITYVHILVRSVLWNWFYDLYFAILHYTTPSKLVVYKPMGAEHAADHTIAQWDVHVPLHISDVTISLHCVLCGFERSYRALKLFCEWNKRKKERKESKISIARLLTLTTFSQEEGREQN